MQDPLLESLMQLEENEDVESLLEAQLKEKHPVKLYRLLKEDWDSGSVHSAPPQIKAEIWEKLEKEMIVQREVKGSSWNKRKMLSAVFAALLLIIVSTLLLNVFNKGKASTSFSSAQKVNQSKAPQQLNLGGALTAWLAKGSAMDYDRSLVGTVKSVYLKGSGYFEMSPDSNHSLMIHTSQLFIEALGARINIEDVKDQQIRVAILEGEAYIRPKQRLNEEPSRIHLLTGDELRYNLNDHRSTVYLVNEEGSLAWRKEDIAFNHHSMESAFLILESYFNVRFEYDRTKIQHCTTNEGPKPIIYSKGSTIEKILDSLFKRKKLKYTINRNIISVTGKGC